RPPVFVSPDRDGARLWELTKQFYQKRGNATAWIADREARPQMDALIGALQQPDREGLDPALYNASTLAAKRQEAGRGFLTERGFDESEAAGLDVWLKSPHSSYRAALARGVANLSHADPQWKIKGTSTDVAALLEQSIDRNRVAESLAELMPSHAQYLGLPDALQKYRQIAQQGGWPQIPATLKLKPGQQNAAVPTLAKRLSITGDLTGP